MGLRRLKDGCQPLFHDVIMHRQYMDYNINTVHVCVICTCVSCEDVATLSVVGQVKRMNVRTLVTLPGHA